MKARILQKPLLTEKATTLAEKGIYAFEVAPAANKIEIAAAVESQFGVNVESVRTLWMPIRRRSQFTRKGVMHGQKSRRKKAIVEIRKGQTIDVFTPMDVKSEGEI
jgi:large subunit ribosomal protein L23